MAKRSTALIRKLHLSPHPEGGFYRELFRSREKVTSHRERFPRSAISTILFLLEGKQISRFHSISHDEIWHFYEGDCLEITEIHPTTLRVTKKVLGFIKGQFIHVVKARTWQAARSLGKYSLSGCTVAPGFEFKDLRFLDDNKVISAKVITKHPELAYLL